MDTMDMKPLVEQAVLIEWSRFAEEHPKLAQVLSEPLLLAGVETALQNDPAYRGAIDQAVALNAGLEAISSLIADAVKRWFAKLV
ncbi:MAG: hypothetical protein QM770_03790 [Tepidisphaeraceae bacterium]